MPEGTVDELCEAIDTLSESEWSVTIGNIAEQLGLGQSNADYAQLHELIGQAIRENRVSYVGTGEYATGPLTKDTPVPAEERTHFPNTQREFLDDQEPWEANRGRWLAGGTAPVCADTSYNNIVAEVLGEFLECEPLGQPTE